MALIEELKEITTGIYVLTVRDGEVRHGMSSSWVTQVSGEPPLLASSVDRAHFSHAILHKTRRFALNVVPRDPRTLEDYFYSEAGRRPDNLAPLRTEDSPAGLPWLLDALVSFDCAVESEHPAGDHTLFVARIEAARRRATGAPLTSLDLDYVYLGTGRIVPR